MGKIINIDKYPEGLELLASSLKLPFPEEEKSKREAYVMAFVNAVIKL